MRKYLNVNSIWFCSQAFWQHWQSLSEMLELMRREWNTSWGERVECCNLSKECKGVLFFRRFRADLSAYRRSESPNAFCLRSKEVKEGSSFFHFIVLESTLFLSVSLYIVFSGRFGNFWSLSINGLKIIWKFFFKRRDLSWLILLWSQSSPW